MSDVQKLREMTNAVRITGKLKEMNLEVKPNKNDPKVKQIMGHIIIMSVVDNKVNEHRVELFAKDSSKLYKGYETIMKEYKAIDVVGKEEATRLTVTGSINGNDYLTADGQLKETNRIRGLFVNRVEDDSIQDEALAQIELVVTGTRPQTDKDGAETGAYHIDGFTVGYDSNVIVLQNLIVGEKLADAILGNYDQNSTGVLTFRINNYVEVVQREADPFAESAGFGVQVDLGSEAKNYTRNLEVIGGFPAYLDERALDDEAIALAKKIRALKVQEIVNSVPSVPPQAGGFGQNGLGANQTGTIDISDDDLPF